MIKETKVISISKDNYEKLVSLGRYGDSMNNIMDKVLSKF